MRERPIIFGPESVRAILSGRKTQTRRIVRDLNPTLAVAATRGDVIANALRCPYGAPGAFLWVREAFRQGQGSMSVHYRADEDEVSGGPWRSPIFMPRWASRITPEITDVRVQRLQEIGQGDACAEGAPQPLEPIAWFSHGWDSLNAKRGYSWESDPWVWAITFRELEARGQEASA